MFCQQLETEKKRYKKTQKQQQYIYEEEGNVLVNTFIYGYIAFAHGAMGRRIDPSWAGPIELFLVPASAPRLV